MIMAMVMSVVASASALPAFANDWGMGKANSHIAPSSIFSPVSTPAHEIETVAFFVIAITVAIFLIVAGLLAYSIVRFRTRPGDDGREPPQVYGSNPIEFAWTTVPLLIVFVLILITARTIYIVQAAPRPPGAINVHVIAHQWWWEFRYPDLGVVTANELHVPVSDPRHPTPTFLDLESADVAHSFWVPRLAGKTDVIPNQKNSMWIDPHRSGTYLGQCGEFCGTEHAMMLLRVIVEPRGQFDRWAAAECAPAAQNLAQNPEWQAYTSHGNFGPVPAAPAAEAVSVAHGLALFQSTACVNCHTVRGTDANGRFGPDLTHLMTRETLGAGVAINTPEHLRIWVHDPSVMKPGALMPAMNLSDHDLDDLVAWMETLR